MDPPPAWQFAQRGVAAVRLLSRAAQDLGIDREVSVSADVVPRPTAAGMDEANTRRVFARHRVARATAGPLRFLLLTCCGVLVALLAFRAPGRTRSAGTNVAALRPWHLDAELHELNGSSAAADEELARTRKQRQRWRGRFRDFGGNVTKTADDLWLAAADRTATQRQGRWQQMRKRWQQMCKRWQQMRERWQQMRERTRLLSGWYSIEAPFWRWWRRRKSSGDDAHLVMLREDFDTGAAAGPEQKRLRSALDATCQVLAAAGVPGLAEHCPEAIVSHSLLLGDGVPSMRGCGPIWSVADQGSGAIVAQRELVARLSDAELRALLGLHIGRHILGPQMPLVWNWGRWWMIHRLYRGYGDAQALVLGALKQLRQQPTQRRKKAHGLNKLASRSLVSGRATARDATLLFALSQAGMHRNRALVVAADRLALLAAGGSVSAVAAAMAKSHDYAGDALPLKVRVLHMREWACTTQGQELISDAQARLKAMHVRTVTVVTGVMMLRVFLALAAITTILLSIFWFSAGTAAVALNALFASSAVSTLLVAKFTAWSFAPPALSGGSGGAEGAAGAAADVLGGQGPSLTALTQSALLALGLYSAIALLSARRRAQLKSAGKQTTVESLINEALPAAVEASVGAALLARCSVAAQKRPLFELDAELKVQWASALRGLTAKVEDLRRLSGETELVVQLCGKIEGEARRILGSELLWMRQALDPGHEGPLEKVLMWWQQDDGQGGTGFSPRQEVATEPKALDKLPYPSLAAAGVPPEILHAAPGDSKAAKQAATALAERHRQLDRLLLALRQAEGRGAASAGISAAVAERLGFRACGGSLALSLRGLLCCGRLSGRADASLRAFFADRLQRKPSCCEGARRPSVARCHLWNAALPLVILATLAAVRTAFVGMALLRQPQSTFNWNVILECVILVWAHCVLLRRMQEMCLPYLWAQLDACLVELAAEREQLLGHIRLPEQRSRLERLAHLKVLVLLQGVRTAQNLDYLTLCIQSEALKRAAAAELSSRGGSYKARKRSGKCEVDTSTKEFMHQCLQLLYALLPRHGRQGQRQVSSDMDVQMAMVWFDKPPLTGSNDQEASLHDIEEGAPSFGPPAGFGAAPSPAQLRGLQVALATSQRQLWMLFRLCDLRAMSQVQGTLSGVLDGQLRPIVLESRLRLDALPSMFEPTTPPSPPYPPHGAGAPLIVRPAQDGGSGRLLGDLDTTAESNDGSSDKSSVTAHRILALSASASEASEADCCGDGDGGGYDGGGGGGGRGHGSRGGSSLGSDSDDCSSVGADRDGMQRILAASDVSDGASSESASSAGFQSFGLPTSMWSGMSRSNASSSSSLGEALLTHHRPLIEGYASALRPLFMTRGDLTHLLLKFPSQVLLGNSAANARSFAAHRELLEELFGSVVIAVKSPERRGKVKLAFGASFSYGREPYTMGQAQTTIQIVAHGVKRLGHEPFPPLYEEEGEDDEHSEACVSIARDDVTEHGTHDNSPLEFEEIVVPFTEISSRELFLAELMQSDQCQLLASLSLGSHSKYGHRALRRRRRTLRHVREATQLLVNVPDQ